MHIVELTLALHIRVIKICFNVYIEFKLIFRNGEKKNKFIDWRHNFVIESSDSLNWQFHKYFVNIVFTISTEHDDEIYLTLDSITIITRKLSNKTKPNALINIFNSVTQYSLSIVLGTNLFKWTKVLPRLLIVRTGAINIFYLQCLRDGTKTFQLIIVLYLIGVIDQSQRE